MKKLTIAVLSAACFLFTSCGGEEKKDDKKSEKKEGKKEEVKVEEEIEVEVKMTELDLSEYGYKISIAVPEGVTFEKGEYEDKLKNADNSFAITLSRMDYTKEESLNEAKENDVNVFKALLDETETGYFIETEVMGKADFHMWMVVNDGIEDEDPIILENDKGNMSTKANSTVMFNSLKTIQVK